MCETIKRGQLWQIPLQRLENLPNVSWGPYFHKGGGVFFKEMGGRRHRGPLLWGSAAKHPGTVMGYNGADSKIPEGQERLVWAPPRLEALLLT